ncbi:VWA domain-containing protein [Actinoplanes sp. OR16]|uniref:vWA domain-containing protein n=1 Tax=Actinoplanes sp. OR16 TaxID=946334 RepID=UPI000F6E34A3|nr:VWA domain-containing protein [Actinoplanes sp. OR16]BBH67976.1 VWA domain-containing protein [Actinoplanes sp. OR16]
MPDQTGPPGLGGRLRTIVAALVALAIAGGAQFAMERAESDLVLLIAAMVMAAVSIWSLAYRNSIALALDKFYKLWREMSPRARIGAAGGLAVVLAASAVAVFGEARDFICEQALELRVLTSPEGLQATREVAHAYARFTARGNDGCPAVYPYVYAAGTLAATGALARQWADSKEQRPLEQLGPRPDAWLPDSMLDVRAVQEITVKATLPSPLHAVTSIASSPIILAGTKVPESGDATLSGVVEEILDDDGVALSAADPETSTAGLLAADVYLHDATGDTVEASVARRRAQIVADSTVAATDEVSVLCAYLREGKAPEAVLTSLRTWRRFAGGRALGGAGCPSPRTPPADLPAPVVVASAPALDHPFVQFTWTGERQKAAADGFRAWLQGTDADTALREAGLGEPDPGCSGLNGNACLPRDLTATLTRYEQAKRPGRVLLAVDASGSMAQQAGSGKATRFAVAAQGVGAAIAQMGARDEFGLWRFPIPDGQKEYELVAPAPGSARHREAIAGALKAVKPQGGTPLYATIQAGMRELAGTTGDQIRAFVVLTDGENTGARPGLKQTSEEVARLTAAGVRLYVIATGEAKCDDSGELYQLTRAGRGGCLTAGAAEVPETMTQLFQTLWSGR